MLEELCTAGVAELLEATTGVTLLEERPLGVPFELLEEAAVALLLGFTVALEVGVTLSDDVAVALLEVATVVLLVALLSLLVAASALLLTVLALLVALLALLSLLALLVVSGVPVDCASELLTVVSSISLSEAEEVISSSVSVVPPIGFVKSIAEFESEQLVNIASARPEMQPIAIIFLFMIISPIHHFFSNLYFAEKSLNGEISFF